MREVSQGLCDALDVAPNEAEFYKRPILDMSKDSSYG